MTGAPMQLSEMLRGRQDRRHADGSGPVPADHLLDARARSQRFLLAVADRRCGCVAVFTLRLATFAASLRGSRSGRRRGTRRTRGRVRRRRGRSGARRGGDSSQSRDQFDVQAEHLLRRRRSFPDVLESLDAVVRLLCAITARCMHVYYACHSMNSVDSSLDNRAMVEQSAVTNISGRMIVALLLVQAERGPRGSRV